MGLQDRDYMKERARERKREEDSGWFKKDAWEGSIKRKKGNKVWTAVYILVVLGLLFKFTAEVSRHYQIEPMNNFFKQLKGDHVTTPFIDTVPVQLSPAVQQAYARSVQTSLQSYNSTPECTFWSNHLDKLINEKDSAGAKRAALKIAEYCQ